MNPIQIYTDGACTGNGTSEAKAGVGVYFGLNNPNNISVPLEGDLQTNNRAELTAFVFALGYIAQYTESSTQAFEIISDSIYCVKGYTEWLDGWVARGWKKSDGKPVKNEDLWRCVHYLKQKIEQRQFILYITWTKGHSDSEGNIAADALAVQGARKHIVDDSI